VFLILACLDETCHDATIASKARKKFIKEKFDKSDNHRVFSEGDLVLLYNQDHEKLGARKFEPMLHGPYIVKCELGKGSLI